VCSKLKLMQMPSKNQTETFYQSKNDRRSETGDENNVPDRKYRGNVREATEKVPLSSFLPIYGVIIMRIISKTTLNILKLTLFQWPHVRRGKVHKEVWLI
jgi:hypothetical protein